MRMYCVQGIKSTYKGVGFVLAKTPIQALRLMLDYLQVIEPEYYEENLHRLTPSDVYEIHDGIHLA